MTAPTRPVPDRAAAMRTVNAQRAAATNARIEDLEFLIDAGVDVEDALRRVEWNAGAAAQALRRRGHRLANLVGRARNRRQRGDE